jgi:hypothetical protein
LIASLPISFLYLIGFLSVGSYVLLLRPAGSSIWFGLELFGLDYFDLDLLSVGSLSLVVASLFDGSLWFMLLSIMVTHFDCFSLHWFCLVASLFVGLILL